MMDLDNMNKKTIEFIQENVFFKSYTWDTFTVLGRFTLYPIIFLCFWVIFAPMALVMYPLMILIDKLNLEQHRQKLSTWFERLFIKHNDYNEWMD